MNKKLMAIAVAGAIGAPGLAFAQAANVNIYGVLDGRYDSMRFSSSTTQAAGTSTIGGLTKNHVQFQAPRWGLRGSESLGGGLTAYFQLESGLNPDGRPDVSVGTGGVTTLGGRDSWLGIRSATWGSIQAGGFGTAFKTVNAAYNANPSFNHGGVIMGNGDSTGASPGPNCASPGFTTLTVVPPNLPSGLSTATATISCGNLAEGATNPFSRRESNYIEYATPSFSGFVGKIGTIASEFAEPATTTSLVAPGLSQSKPKLWSYSLAWSGGPWSAAAAYETHTGYRATNVGGSNRNAKDKAWSVGGKWDFGQGQIGAGWESMDYGNAGTGVALGNNAFKQKFWVVNGNWRVTPAGVLSAGYSKTPGRKSCGDQLTQLVGGVNLMTTTGAGNGGGGCGDASGAKLWTFGYDHNLSKRTALYAQYHKLDNNGNATGGAGYYYIAGPTGNAANGVSTGGPAIGSNGIDVTTIAVGVKHSF